MLLAVAPLVLRILLKIIISLLPGRFFETPVRKNEPRQGQGQGQAQGQGQDHEKVRRRRVALQLQMVLTLTLTLPWLIFPHWGRKELARLRLQKRSRNGLSKGETTNQRHESA